MGLLCSAYRVDATALSVPVFRCSFVVLLLSKIPIVRHEAPRYSPNMGLECDRNVATPHLALRGQFKTFGRVSEKSPKPILVDRRIDAA